MEKHTKEKKKNNARAIAQGSNNNSEQKKKMLWKYKKKIEFVGFLKGSMIWMA
jgi:hypothetical protein